MTMRAPHNVPKTKNHLTPPQSSDVLEALDAALRRLMWLEHVWLRQTLAKYEMDVAPFMILNQLIKHDGVCPMGELAHALEQPNATTTGHVDRLEQKGLVRREFGNQQDRRQVRVHVTPQGTALALRVKELRREHIQRALSHLDVSEREQFMRLLQNFLNELESAK